MHAMYMYVHTIISRYEFQMVMPVRNFVHTQLRERKNYIDYILSTGNIIFLEFFTGGSIYESCSCRKFD